MYYVFSNVKWWVEIDFKWCSYYCRRAVKAFIWVRCHWSQYLKCAYGSALQQLRCMQSWKSYKQFKALHIKFVNGFSVCLLGYFNNSHFCSLRWNYKISRWSQVWLLSYATLFHELYAIVVRIADELSILAY